MATSIRGRLGMRKTQRSKMKRYKFTKLTKDYYGVTLKQIQAIADFGYAKKGDLGGYIKDESCLPQDSTGWVYPNGVICGGEMYGGVWKYSPLQIQGSRHFVNVCDEKGNVRIGCFQKHIDEWLKCCKDIWKSEEYTPEQIAEYHDYLKLAKKWIKAHKIESVGEAK